MNLAELKNLLNKFEKDESANLSIVIDLDQVSIGTKAYSDISTIYAGLDWQSGQIRIVPSKSLIEKKKDRDIATPKVKDKIFHRGFYVCPACGSFVNKLDKYCCSCGQNIEGVQEN